MSEEKELKLTPEAIDREAMKRAEEWETYEKIPSMNRRDIYISVVVVVISIALIIWAILGIYPTYI